MGAVKKVDQKPNIFDYHDYRKFLSDQINYLRKSNPKFSLRSLAKQAGVAPSYFTMILNGTAAMSDRVIMHLEKPLQLTMSEINFLARLAHLVDARNLEDQKLAFNKIVKFDNYRTKQNSGLLAHQYISKWYYVAIRELAKRPDFSEDTKWINNNLVKKVSATDIREALNFLLKFGLILKNGDGKYEVIDKNIECEGPLYRLALTEFYKQTYDLCIQSIFSTPRNERFLASRTMTVSEEGFKEIEKILAESIEKLQKVTDKEKERQAPKRVYHISVASFPMSKKRGENG